MEDEASLFRTAPLPSNMNAPARRLRLEAYVRDVRAMLDSLPTSSTSSPTVRRKLRTLVSLLGTRATERVLQEIEDALAAEGVFANPAIGGNRQSLDDWIELSLEPFSDEPALFAREKDLVAFVEHSLGVGLFRGLVPYTKGESGSGREHRLPDNRRIDLLCEERTRRGRGALVAIEFKRAHDEGAVAQMMSYLRTLREQFPDRQVRGIIISGTEDQTATDLVAALRDCDIQLVVYDIRFRVITPATER